MELRQLKGYKNLVRDVETGAVLNMNTETPQGLKLAKLKKRKEQDQLEKNTNDINSIKSEISDIKTMLKTLVERN